MGQFIVFTHVVAHATDIGIDPIPAANILAFIGGLSILGRMLMGRVSDRIGTKRALTICLGLFSASVFSLTLITELWQLYLFAVFCGFAYGGAMPQYPGITARLFGTKAMGKLFGMVVLMGTIGGAIGSWLGGRVYDVTNSYTLAFLIAGISLVVAAIISLRLKMTAND